jgi:hypothetical protein
LTRKLSVSLRSFSCAKGTGTTYHSFHYIFAPYASAYATRLTKYTRRRRLQRGHHHQRDGSGEAVECCRTRCSVILEMDDLTEALRYFTSLCASVFRSD